MSAPRSGDLLTAGTIQWPVDPPCGSGGPDGASSAQWTRAQALATEWLWALSGRRFGLVDVVFRAEWTIPERMPPRHLALGGPSWPGSFPTAPLVSNIPITEAPLPGPVNSVTSVLVDNITLAASAYLVEQNNLIRVDGGQWYRFQDNSQPTTEVGTWQVTYVRGLTVPEGGEWAVGVLACELALRMLGNAKCRLPANTVTAARNGVTVSLDAKQLQQGFTGIYEVDQWVRLVNPKLRPSESTVWSPDLDSTRLPRIPTAQSATA